MALKVIQPGQVIDTSPRNSEYLRKLAAAMMQQGQVRTVGQGINSAAKSLAGAYLAKQAQEREAKNKAEIGAIHGKATEAMVNGLPGWNTPDALYADPKTGLQSSEPVGPRAQPDVAAGTEVIAPTAPGMEAAARVYGQDPRTAAMASAMMQQSAIDKLEQERAAKAAALARKQTLEDEQAKRDAETALQAQKDEAAMARERFKASGGGTDFGKGALGPAMNIYSKLMKKQTAGIPLTPDEQVDLANAQWMLTLPGVQRDAAGNLLYVPRPALPGAPGATAPAVTQPQAPQQPGPQAPQRDPNIISPAPMPEVRRKSIEEAYTSRSNLEASIDILKKVQVLNQKGFSSDVLDATTKRDLVRQFGFLMPESAINAMVATTEVETALLQQVLPQLRQIFGSMPTEGERKILLQMEASADMSAEERGILLRNSIEAAQRRLGVTQGNIRNLDPDGELDPLKGVPRTVDDIKNMDYDDLIKADLVNLPPALRQAARRRLMQRK